MTVQDLLDCGFVELVDFKDNLCYLEFVYVNELKYETNYRIGTIICDINGDIYRATLMGYAFSEGELYRAFPQIISKTDGISISDIFKNRQNSNYYTEVVSIKDTLGMANGSKVWSKFIKGNRDYSIIEITINNVANKEYFTESKEEFRISEHFRNEHENFKMLADKIRNGLLGIAASIDCGLRDLGISVETAHGIPHLSYQTKELNKSMENYTIYCTEKQTKKAFDLGAPIAVYIYTKGECKDGYKPIDEFIGAIIPTAEQMIGWLEEQGIFINVKAHTPYRIADWRKTIYTFSVADKFIFVCKHGGYNDTTYFHSHKEATLTAIDVALDYLNNKEK